LFCQVYYLLFLNPSIPLVFLVQLNSNVDQTFQTQIIKIFIHYDRLFVGAINSSDCSGIRFLFLASCNVVFLIQTIDTTFQIEINNIGKPI
jgi:hypothetical protein